MSTIEELRRRVEAAEHRFGLIDEQERRYSERLIDLMNALEAAQTEKQAEAAAHQARLAELERENGELRGMLHALLLGVEAGSRDTLADTLHDLDSRLSGLLNAAPIPAESVAVAEEPVARDPVIEAESPTGEILAEATETTEPDAVVAAEQAVAGLIGANLATEAAAHSEATLDGAEGAGAESPVAELIDRLEEETQFFPELAVADDTAQAPAPEPARKKA